MAGKKKPAATGKKCQRSDTKNKSKQIKLRSTVLINRRPAGGHCEQARYVLKLALNLLTQKVTILLGRSKTRLWRGMTQNAHHTDSQV